MRLALGPLGQAVQAIATAINQDLDIKQDSKEFLENALTVFQTVDHATQEAVVMESVIMVPVYAGRDGRARIVMKVSKFGAGFSVKIEGEGVSSVLALADLSSLRFAVLITHCMAIL